ncbi:hypothetical protein RYX36_001091 [Vicia faba]
MQTLKRLTPMLIMHGISINDGFGLYNQVDYSPHPGLSEELETSTNVMQGLLAMLFR